MLRVDRTLPIPAYYQISVDLRRRIADGEWSETTRLPPEPGLAEQYQVSRTTVRQALLELENDGILVRKRPMGTFIKNRPPRSVPTLSLPVSFVRSLTALGHSPNVLIREAREMPVPSGDIAAALQIGQEDKVAYFERLFALDGRLLTVVRSAVPERICPGITAVPLVDSSLHATLSAHYGITLTRADHFIETVRADEGDAADLEIETGSPLLLLSSIYYDGAGRPIEYVLMRWNGDGIRLNLTTTIEELPLSVQSDWLGRHDGQTDNG